jgi:ribonuclease-3
MTLEESLGYFFFDKRVLARAISSKAYALEQQQLNQPCEDQEAYRSLGAAMLQTVLIELLIRAGYKTQAEIGDRTADLENPENLARISQVVGAGYVVKLSTEEKQQQAYDHPDVLAGTLQAIIGGIYFDGGYRAAREVIRGLFRDVFVEE